MRGGVGPAVALPALMAFAALLAAAAGGAGIGWIAHAPRNDVVAYAGNRLVAIRQHLDEAEPGFVLIAGDSQAELQSPSAQVCGRPVVNAGVSGASAAVYAELLADLDVPVRASAAVLTIGTNDLIAKKDPLAPDRLDGFEREAGAIADRLASLADRVVVTALPPLGREAAGDLDARAVGPYSERIRSLCGRIGCVYADPFAAFRDGETGFGRPGVNRNGLHLARYRPVLDALAATLCPEGSADR